MQDNSKWQKQDVGWILLFMHRFLSNSWTDSLRWNYKPNDFSYLWIHSILEVAECKVFVAIWKNNNFELKMADEYLLIYFKRTIWEGERVLFIYHSILLRMQDLDVLVLDADKDFFLEDEKFKMEDVRWRWVELWDHKTRFRLNSFV